jgi:competence protein ComEA
MESTRDGDEGSRAGRDALAALSARTPIRARVRLGVGAVVVLAIGALVVAVVIAIARGGGAPSVVPSVSITAERGSRAAATNDATPSATFVHVLGAVAKPGLYPLSTGARVVDAIAAAGGFTEQANPAGVNLARPVADGEQLLVPAVGEPIPEPAGQGGAAGGVAGAGSGGGVGGTVNLNTASSEQLQTLPRVGPALAGRIIAWRTANGRFASVDDLLNVSGIGEKTLEGLRELVTT